MTDKEKLEQDVRGILGSLCQMYWGRCIIRAARRGWFTMLDKRLAVNWPTCACGKMHHRKRFNRIRKGVEFARMPLNYHLKGLGSSFYTRVKCDQIKLAAECMVKIEARGSKIAKGSRS